MTSLLFYARNTELNGAEKIVHRFPGQRVIDILKQKKGSIKQAQLPEGSPTWDDFGEMLWEEIEEGVAANRPGFKVVRKLLAIAGSIYEKRHLQPAADISASAGAEEN